MYFIWLWTYWSRRVLTPPLPSPFLLAGGCESPDQHLSPFLTPNLIHQMWRNDRKMWQCCGRRKWDEQNPLLGQNLLSRRQPDMAPTGSVTESWVRSVQEEIASKYHPYTPTSTTVLSYQQDKTTSFSSSVFWFYSSSSQVPLTIEVVFESKRKSWPGSSGWPPTDLNSSSARTEGSSSASVVLEQPEEGDDLQRSWWEERKGREKEGGSSWKLTLFEPILSESWHTRVSDFQRWGDTRLSFWSVPNLSLDFH